jgi:hypothetical protein
MKMVIAMKVNGTKKKNMDLEYIYIKLQVLWFISIKFIEIDLFQLRST